MPPLTYRPVRRLPLNSRGRDFIVGDLHGRADLLMNALKAAAFDTNLDRLFLVGDLVDRGPYSPECLTLLGQPWAHSVRGNHEQMALEAFDADGELREEECNPLAFHRNGLSWWLDLTAAERRPLLQAISMMPFVLEVETIRGKVGILHAEVPPGMTWQTFIQKIESLDPPTLESCIWGRRRLSKSESGSYAEGVPGIGRVFVGHTVQEEGVRRLGNIYAVDTGAVFSARDTKEQLGLTMANLLVATQAIAKPAPQFLRLLSEVPAPIVPFGTGLGYEFAKPR